MYRNKAINSINHCHINTHCHHNSTNLLSLCYNTLNPAYHQQRYYVTLNNTIHQYYNNTIYNVNKLHQQHSQCTTTISYSTISQGTNTIYRIISSNVISYTFTTTTAKASTTSSDDGKTTTTAQQHSKQQPIFKTGSTRLKQQTTHSAQREFALSLYKALLKSHRIVLDPIMRDMGDTYLRDEWKRHKNAQLIYLQPFFEQWLQYLGQLKQAYEQNMGTIGRELSADERTALNEDQLKQLNDLEAETKKIDDMWLSTLDEVARQQTDNDNNHGQ